MDRTRKWFVIVNPASGKKNGRSLWENELSVKLKQEEISYQQLFTEYAGHATEITKKAIADGFYNILAIGGDGTYNEVVNGIMGQKEVPSTDILFTVIATGTGNDWLKTLKIPQAIEEIVGLMKSGENYLLHDVGLVRYYEGEEQHQRYFLNVGGTGFDAFVAQRMVNVKKFGRLSYLIGLLQGLFQYQNVPIIVRTETRMIKEKVFMVAVAVCQYFGSGMKIAPDAVPNDGLFDITLIKDISKMGVAMELKNLFNGKFVTNPKVETFRTTSLNIKSKESIFLQLDGELVGHGPIQFEIVPQSLKILIK